jgi:hypothetical protein
MHDAHTATRLAAAELVSEECLDGAALEEAQLHRAEPRDQMQAKGLAMTLDCARFRGRSHLREPALGVAGEGDVQVDDRPGGLAGVAERALEHGLGLAARRAGHPPPDSGRIPEVHHPLVPPLANARHSGSSAPRSGPAHVARPRGVSKEPEQERHRFAHGHLAAFPAAHRDRVHTHQAPELNLG